jgi:hypothetical protein
MRFQQRKPPLAAGFPHTKPLPPRTSPPQKGTLNPTPAPAPAPAPVYSTPPPTSKDGQLRALLAVMAALDGNSSGLPGWTAAKGAGGGFCSFAGVTCDSAGDVVKIDLGSVDWAGGGTLPLASVLAGLPKLREVSLYGLSLRGTLPRDWGLLGGLGDVDLSTNELTGSLPPEWKGLGALKALHLK